MTTGIKNLLATMQATADPARLAGMARHGINTDKRLGLTMPSFAPWPRTSAPITNWPWRYGPRNCTRRASWPPCWPIRARWMVY